MKIITPVNKLGYVTQIFGDNPKYYSQFDMKGHNGIDYGTNMKPGPVYAVFDGECICTEHKIYGKQIRLYSDCGRYMARYAHLSDYEIANGTKVKIGDMIGHTGNTGNSNGIHLHFSVYEVDKSRNKLNTNNGYFGAIEMGSFGKMVTVKNNDINVYSRKDNFLKLLTELSKKQVIALWKGKFFINHKGKKQILTKDNIQKYI